jgi:hypothetical protein
MLQEFLRVYANQYNFNIVLEFDIVYLNSVVLLQYS